MSAISDTIHNSVQKAKAELRARLVAPLIAETVIWVLIVLFGIAGLVFLYALADRYLAERLQDPLAAAGILAAANILLAVILLLARSAMARR